MFSSFNGAKPTTTGGRDAKDNNTLFLFGWVSVLTGMSMKTMQRVSLVFGLFAVLAASHRPGPLMWRRAATCSPKVRRVPQRARARTRKGRRCSASSATKAAAVPTRCIQTPSGQRPRLDAGSSSDAYLAAKVRARRQDEIRRPRRHRRKRGQPAGLPRHAALSVPGLKCAQVARWQPGAPGGWSGPAAQAAGCCCAARSEQNSMPGPSPRRRPQGPRRSCRWWWACSIAPPRPAPTPRCPGRCRRSAGRSGRWPWRISQLSTSPEAISLAGGARHPD